MTNERIVCGVLMSAALLLGVTGCPPEPPDDADAGIGGSAQTGGTTAMGGSATGGSAPGGTAGASVGQPLPGADQFTSLTLTKPGAPASGSPCVDGDPPATFSVTAATGGLRWDGCGPYGREWTCRTLDTAEFSSVRATLDQVQLGASGVCVADAQGSTLDLVTPGGTGQYASDDRSCEPPPAGRKFVTGLNVLRSGLASLTAPVRLTNSFASLKFGWVGGMPSPPADACQVADYDNRIIVAADTRSLSWNYCDWTGEVMAGSRPLVEPEWNLILVGLSKLQVGWRCLAFAADFPLETLDLVRADTVERYVDDTYGRNPPFDGRTFVMHLEDLSGSDPIRLAPVLMSLTRYTSLVAFDHLTLSSGEAPNGVPAGSECEGYGATYDFDNVRAELSWEECVGDNQGIYRVRLGSRTVTENERTLIWVSVAQLTPGIRGYYSCQNTPPTTLLVEAAGATARYVSDEWADCDPLPEGTFVRNLHVMDILQTLART